MNVKEMYTGVSKENQYSDRGQDTYLKLEGIFSIIQRVGRDDKKLFCEADSGWFNMYRLTQNLKC